MDYKFQNLRVYQEALKVSLRVYEITSDWPPRYRYNLADQLIRATLSITLNIAEGTSRTTNDFKHFISISRGSCYECIPLIEIANKLELISPKEHAELYNQYTSIAKMLSALKSKL